ncbi:NUDIX domain-containing protein [bacterium A37T11]|nr:NUDIX domain-containing protein [bacterium A37T11]
MSYFNIRVYGFLVNDKAELLISDEKEYGMLFSKFPGGGLELGEGLVDGLKREFQEECGAIIEVHEHIHTTDTYVQSAFNDSQVIAVYYKVKLLSPILYPIKTKKFDFGSDQEPLQAFRWVSLETFNERELTFEIDKQALNKFLMTI